jgi:hypothetical protein
MDVKTYKSQIMEALYGVRPVSELSTEAIEWANSHLPNVDSKGQQVAEGMDFSKFPLKESSNDLDRIGITKEAMMKLENKIRSVVREIPGNETTAGELAIRLSKKVNSSEMLFFMINGLEKIREDNKKLQLIQRLLKGDSNSMLGMLGDLDD